MDRVAPVAVRPWSMRLRGIEAGTLACTFALAVVGFLVLYPLWLLILNSFQVGTFGTATTWGLDNWRVAFTDPSLSAAIANTITLAVTRQAISLLIAIPIAWLIARTDLPGRNWFEFGFWIAVFLPPLTALLGWILLFDGFKGLVNTTLKVLPFIQQSPFDIFSWWGIIFAHVIGTTLGIKVMLLTPAFRSLDSSLEEASRASGASTPGTLFRILVPLLAPSILVVTLLGLIHALESFEIELVLGAPASIDVYSTKIYRLMRLEPPQYGSATALSSLILVALVPLILVQQWLVQRHSYVTVTGRYRSVLFRLGRWKWPTFALMALLVGAMTVVPVVLVILGSFMKVFGAFNVANPWTMNNWNDVLKGSAFVSASWNTFVLATSSSVVAMLAFAVLAYILVRTRFFGRSTLDFLTWIPFVASGDRHGPGLSVVFPGEPSVPSVLRKHGSVGDGCGAQQHDPICPNDQVQSAAARRRARRGVARQRRCLVVHLPTDSRAAHGTDARGSGHSCVRQRLENGQPRGAAGVLVHTAALADAARLYDRRHVRSRISGGRHHSAVHGRSGPACPSVRFECRAAGRVVALSEFRGGRLSSRASNP